VRSIRGGRKIKKYRITANWQVGDGSVKGGEREEG